ncbi:MAG: hypothetical protein ACTIC1_20760 [Brevibacterium sp.]|uniref:hypothetical protein n=1 Tax=Brevibacterium aurantiacum TaxID=273384 RepID=UPI000F6484EF|nr:hypothetical protein [Brevibacterium aurantiacum]AZL09811.1 hypothetical protein CXR26_11740 [Brevibacterium aurantiacum]MDN5896516.1 hypothetical protein [Nocardioides sp.]
MATQQREGIFSKTEWKFIGFLTLAFVLTPVFYGLPLLSPLFALSTSLRHERRKMTWLWIIASILVLMSIAPFILRAAGLSNFVVK